MKRFSILLLALAFAVAIAAPAMAVHEGSLDTGPPPADMEEGWAMYGDYTLDAEDYTHRTDAQTQWYDDEFQFVIMVDRGPVTATVDLEVSDDENFEGSGKARTGDLVDNYFVVYDAGARVEGLSFKVGEFGNSFHSKAIFYSEGGHQIGAIYSADFGKVGLYLGKKDETKSDPDADDDLITFTLDIAKSIDFFKSLDFIYASGSNEVTAGSEYDYSFFGGYAAFDIGPVPITLEMGSVSDDRDPDTVGGNDGGQYFYMTAGFDEFVGFDLNLEYYNANEDHGTMTFGDDDFFPLMIYGFRSGDNEALADVDLIMVSASYAVSDFLTLKGKVLVAGDEGNAVVNDDDGFADYTNTNDSVGTEIDVHAIMKWAGNVTSTLTYATWSPGDGYTPDDTATDIRLRTVFSW
ncbi:MAG: hypothetical protein JSV26_02805 [bacterium]|nr:MAG: hypothetical protein JSV26_02805 [bacterium]